MEDGKLDIAEVEGGYLFTRTTASGTTRMELSIIDLLTLTQSAVSLRARAAKRLQPLGMGATAVISAPLEKFRAESDSLGEDILLEMLTPQGGQVIYSVPPTTAQGLADELTRVVVELGKQPRKPQA